MLVRANSAITRMPSLHPPSPPPPLPAQRSIQFPKISDRLVVFYNIVRTKEPGVDEGLNESNEMNERSEMNEKKLMIEMNDWNGMIGMNEIK